MATDLLRRLCYCCVTAGHFPGKAKAPGSLVNKGNQGPRYLAVTVGFEPIVAAVATLLGRIGLAGKKFQKEGTTEGG